MSERPATEKAFAEAMKAHRESSTPKMTQAELADKMATRGFRWHPATVYKVENGERQIQVAEAVEIARIFGTTVEEMTVESREVSFLRERVRGIRLVRQDIERDLWNLLGDTNLLAQELEKNDVREHLSDGEYREIYDDVHPPNEVTQAIEELARAVSAWRGDTPPVFGSVIKRRGGKREAL